jgi:hypothetical protein
MMSPQKHRDTEILKGVSGAHRIRFSNILFKFDLCASVPLWPSY